MKLLLALLVVAILFWCFIVPPIIRAYARSLADDIIFSRQPGTEERINKCISFLTWSNKWITSKAHDDLIRIRKLNVILKEIQNSHG